PSPTPSPTPTTGTFGTTTVGGSTDRFSTDRKRVNSATLPVSGQVTSLDAYLAPSGTSGSQALTGLIYADSGGAPGAFIAATNPITFVSTQPAGWYPLSFASPVPLAAGTYWIGLATGGTSLVTGFRYTTVTNSRSWNSAIYTA